MAVLLDEAFPSSQVVAEEQVEDLGGALGIIGGDLD